jgi:hypothetical protein
MDAMKINNTKFAFIFVEKTKNADYAATGKGAWDRLLEIIEPDLKPDGSATRLGGAAWSIDLTRGLNTLAAILHHANISELPVYVLFSKQPIELLSIPPQAPHSAKTQKQAEQAAR